MLKSIVSYLVGIKINNFHGQKTDHSQHLNRIYNSPQKKMFKTLKSNIVLFPVVYIKINEQTKRYNFLYSNTDEAKTVWYSKVHVMEYYFIQWITTISMNA